MVILGSIELFGACWSGKVDGLSSNRDILAVMSGPSTAYKQIDSLFNGNSVFICNRVDKWYRVFYGKNCKLEGGYPVGDCQSGWVYDKYVH
jgi:hypothetical protein